MEDVALKFSFKTVADRDPLTNKPKKDAEGKVVKIKAPEPIELKIPQFTNAADVQSILSKGDEKELKLVIDSLNNVIQAQAKALVDEDREVARKEGIDLSKLDWNFIANIPPSQRGPAIDEETWEEFGKDYVAVMVHHGKTQEKAEMGAKLLMKKFAPVRINKKVIAALKENLTLWMANTENSEEFQEVYEYLMSRADSLLAADEDAIVAAV